MAFDALSAVGGPLLGRDAEVELLTALLARIGEAASSLVVLGEPGIGKSRLLTEAERLARERDIAVPRTVGVQSEAHLAFAGLHQLLRPARARFAALPVKQRAALNAAFGLANEGRPEHFRTAMAVLDLLSDLGSEAPLLITVDDAHRLDWPSADVLAFVARRIESDRILILIAARDRLPSPLATAGLREHRLVGLDPGRPRSCSKSPARSSRLSSASECSARPGATLSP